MAHYDADVNEGGINMVAFTAQLNRRWEDGWKLAHAFEQEGNTIMVWEQRPTPREALDRVTRRRRQR
jgi:hypothetical protein